MAAHQGDDGPRIHAEALKQFVIDVLESYGMRAEDARISADVLVESDLRGIDSHGVPRLAFYATRLGDGAINLDAELQTVRETAATLTLDAQNGFGPPMAYRAMERCIAKAKEAGVCLATVGHSNHYGIAGYYATMALEHPGMAGISMTNATPLLVPTFGAVAMLSTAPIAAAFPAGVEPPFILDGATTAVAWGKVEIARRQGKELPPGLVVDAAGRTVTDPFAAVALSPLGGERQTSGQKGYGLSLLVEMLCSQLSGSVWSRYVSGSRDNPPRPSDTSHAFIAIDVTAFQPLEAFTASVDAMLRELRATPPAAGHERLLIPGDPEREAYADRIERGIPVHPSVIADLRALGLERGVRVPF
ncbi:MAG: oxidoreductase [Chloroflexi bacterium]|nr:MAG: oxidoreductase [Chloroflexota bacterium]